MEVGLCVNHLNSASRLSRRGWLVARQRLNVRNVIPWVAIERLLQTKLVDVVSHEANRAAEHEEPVKAAKRHQIVRFLKRERANNKIRRGERSKQIMEEESRQPDGRAKTCFCQAFMYTRSLDLYVTQVSHG